MIGAVTRPLRCGREPSGARGGEGAVRVDPVEKVFSRARQGSFREVLPELFPGLVPEAERRA